MLVRSNHAAINVMSFPIKLTLRVGLLLEGTQDSVPETDFGPTIEAGRNGGPRAVAFRQVAPRSTSSIDPEHAVDDAAMVLSRMTTLAAFAVALWRKQWLEPLPLCVGQVSSIHTLYYTGFENRP